MFSAINFEIALFINDVSKLSNIVEPSKVYLDAAVFITRWRM